MSVPFIDKLLPSFLRGPVSVVSDRIANRPVTNYFKTKSDCCVLITYITYPFRWGVSLTHSNSAETIEVAKIFRDFGYRVDAVNYNSLVRLDYSRYQFIFGFGDPLINSYYFRQGKILTVYYGTGMHVFHQNTETLRRIEEVYRKRGQWILESGRIVDKTYSVQTSLVDAMITLGNDDVVETYRKYYRGKIYKVPISYKRVFDAEELIQSKNFQDARQNFLWFGGRGLIHKGLDLVLEVFSECPELHLHVCGPIDDEPKFKRLYYEELYNRANIHTHGYTKLDSPLFRELLRKCAFAVFPSCSEGGGGSVVNVMGNGGLLPVVTRESSIDLNDYGVPIRSTSIEDVRSAVHDAAAMDTHEIAARSRRCVETVKEHHSIENYSRQMRLAISEIISGPG